MTQCVKTTNKITINNKSISLPIFLPDATYGVVRNLASKEVQQAGIEGVVVNTYHLMQITQLKMLSSLGGVGSLMNWPGLIVSDSGGFQLFSLINKNPDLGKIIDNGVVFYSGKRKQKKSLFTPEQSIQVQFAIKSDIMICLDDFTPDKADQERQQQSVVRTIDWAKRCKDEFVKQLKERSLSFGKKTGRPQLFAVIQGHRDFKLRKQCADALLDIGFDGYGLGGWLFDDQGKLDYGICQLNAKLTPDKFLRFALGVGNPENIVKLWEMGYHIFDCVLPTRDARHKRLYVFTQDPAQIDLSQKRWFEYLYISRGKFAEDTQPISQNCDCFTCQNHSRAYLHHLFRVKDGLAFKLATIHNLRFYSQLMEILRNYQSQEK